MNDYELLLEFNKILQLEVEKLNHYKTLYNVLKDRKDKAIDYIKENACYDNTLGKYSCLSCLAAVECDELLKILEGEYNE